MKTELWLRIEATNQSRGYEYNHFILKKAEVLRSKPDCNANQVAIKLDVNIPDSWFERPTLSGKIDLPEMSPANIGIEVQQGIEQLVREQMGIKLHISADEPGDAEGGAA